MIDPPPSLSRRERKAAVKAWRGLPVDTRSETVRLARQGRPHPDEGIARVAETWATSVVGGPVWGQVHGWPVVVLGLVVIMLGAVTGSFVVWLIGIVVVVAGFLGWNQRVVARRILVAGQDR